MSQLMNVPVPTTTRRKMMSKLICPTCGTEVIDSETGDVVGCPHFPKDDLTELSGKQMSDGMSIDESDRLAFRLLKENNNGKVTL